MSEKSGNESGESNKIEKKNNKEGSNGVLKFEKYEYIPNFLDK